MSSQEKPLSRVVRERRSTPSFGPQEVAAADLEQILEAGLLAPSGYNTQPWRFVVVRDNEQRKKLRAAAMDQPRVEEAPVTIVACGDARGWKTGDLEEMLRTSHELGFHDEETRTRARANVERDLGAHPEIDVWLTRQVMIAFTQMMLMAEALGYDTSAMEGFYEDRVREVINAPAHVRVIALLCVGKLRGADKRFSGRFDRSRVVFGERWGEPF